ncbi:MAG: hypothetical protein ACI855_004113, partial [Myxococcota bacterium]
MRVNPAASTGSSTAVAGALADGVVWSGMTRSDPTDARPYCYRCDKPESMCLCAHLTPIANTVGIHVLQHPAERR